MKIKIKRNQFESYKAILLSLSVFLSPIVFLFLFNKLLESVYSGWLSSKWFWQTIPVVIGIAFILRWARNSCHFTRFLEYANPALRLINTLLSKLSISEVKKRLILAPYYSHELGTDDPDNQVLKSINQSLRDSTANNWAVPGDDYSYEHISKLARLSYVKRIPKLKPDLPQPRLLSNQGWWSYFRPMSNLANTRSDERSYSILTRAWVSEAVHNVRKLNWDVHEKCEEFVKLEPLDIRDLFIKPKTINQAIQSNSYSVLVDNCFPYWASCLSGALILCDSSICRSSYFSDIKVVHYDGSLDLDNDHESRLTAGKLQQDDIEQFKRNFQPNDYNGDLMDLKRLSVGNGAKTQTTSIILDTTHTTYYHSEAAHYKCKKLEGLETPVTYTAEQISETMDGHSYSIFSAEKNQRQVKSTSKLKERTNILTAYVFLITSDKKLVLTKRSNQTRHGKSILSASAGGVIEVDNDGDLDSYGMPDVGGCVRRELKEELGIELNEENCRPVVVALLNTAAATIDPELKIKEFKGQMTSCAFYFGRTQQNEEEMKKERGSKSDLQKGDFEVTELKFLEMSNIEKFAEHVAEITWSMDQHGFLSCIYASMCVYGPKETQETFSKYFPKKVTSHGTNDLEEIMETYEAGAKTFDLDKNYSWWDPSFPSNIENRESINQIWSSQKCQITKKYKGRATVHPSFLINEYYKKIFNSTGYSPEKQPAS